MVAANLLGHGFHPRQLNISSLIPPASSSSFDPASFSSPNPSLDPVPASTLLPQAPADYCGLCIIEAPGGIRLVYWVSVSFQPFSCRGSFFKLQERSWYTFGMSHCSGLWALKREYSKSKKLCAWSWHFDYSMFGLEGGTLTLEPL